MSRKRKLADSSDEDFDDNISTDFLFQLVKTGQVEELKKYKTDLLVKNENGDTLLHKSLEKTWIGRPGVFCDHLEMVTYLLTTAPGLATLTNRAGETALCFACKNILLPEIRTLVEIYPQEALDIVDKQGSAPLHHLLESQYIVNNLKMLPNGVMSENLNVSAILCKENEILNLIQLLLNKGANINIKNGLNLTPILCILKSEIIRIDYFYNNASKLLIQNGASIDVKSLIYAQTLEIAKLIINNIDIYNTDDNNYSVLHNILLTDESNVREEIIKILIEKDCKITDKKSDIVTLALDNNCKYDTIKTILQKYTEYNINSRGSCGNTILTKFCTDMDNYKMLVKLGADPTIVTNEGYSLLVTAIKLGNIDMVKILIKLGLNPLEYDNNFENNLSITCENLINENNTQNYLYKWTYIFKYIINLPHFKCNLNNEKLFKFYSNLLNTLCNLYNINCRNKIRITRILYILFKQTNINLLIYNNKNINISLGSYSVWYNLGYDILSSIFIVDPLILSSPNDNYTDEFIHNMIDAGYNIISKIPKYYITSLTVYLLYVKTETESQINLIKELINQGVNIESNVLQLNSNTHLSYNALKSFKQNYYLPDVLLLSIMNNQEKLFKIFINYWWGSPLSLLFYKNRSNVFEMMKWYKILAKYGGIPHGTRAFTLFYHFLAQWSRIVTTRPVEVQIEFIPVANHFQMLKRHPLRLKDLAKYAVRLSLAEKASQPGHNLPDLLRQVIDPTLQFLLFH